MRSDEVPQSEAQVFAVPEMPESVAEEVQVEDELAVDESEVIEDDEVEPPQQLSLF